MEREPFTPLENVKHELFAQEVAKGRPLVEAYVTAGYAADQGNPFRLQNMTGVKARIAELNSEAALRAGVSIERVLKELAKIGFSSMADYVTITDDGETVVDLAGVERAKLDAIGEVTTEKIGEMRRTKLKLLDKKGALVDLGRHLGMFVDKTETKITAPIVVSSVAGEI